MKLPRVHRVTDPRTGRVWRYHRRTRAPLPDLPEDHPDFIAAWVAEDRSIGRKVPGKAPAGTLAALVQDFRRSTEFTSLSPDYRRVVAKHLEAIAETGGEVRAVTVQTKHVQANLRPLTPHQADARLKAWRALCRWGLVNGYLTADPARLAKRKPLPRTDGHPPWSQAQIAAFRERWPIGTRERAAMELLYWTGARISDAVRLGPQHVDRDGWLTFTQHKTGGEVSIPIRRALPDSLAALEADRALFLAATAGAEALFLVHMRGAGWVKESFGNWFGALSPEGRSAHGLRKSRAIALAEAGATTHQIAAWTGHESLREVERYSRRADKRRALSGNEAGSEPVKSGVK